MGEHRYHETAPRKWTAEEHQKLVELRDAGHPIREICRLLGRATSSVSGRLKATDANGNFVSRRDRVSIEDLDVDGYIMEMHRMGWSQEQIGMSIGFKPTTIGNRIRMILAKEGQPTAENPDRKDRPCICCRKTFISNDWEHRRCSQCRKNMLRSEVVSDEWMIHI